MHAAPARAGESNAFAVNRAHPSPPYKTKGSQSGAYCLLRCREALVRNPIAQGCVIKRNPRGTGAAKLRDDVQGWVGAASLLLKSGYDRACARLGFPSGCGRKQRFFF